MRCSLSCFTRSRYLGRQQRTRNARCASVQEQQRGLAQARAGVLVVLALLVRVPEVLARPRHVAGLLPALIERNEKMGAVVPVAEIQPCSLHLLLGRLGHCDRERHGQLNRLEVRYDVGAGQGFEFKVLISAPLKLY